MTSSSFSEKDHEAARSKVEAPNLAADVDLKELDVAGGFLARIAREQPELLEPWTIQEERYMVRRKVSSLT